jgi:hypothetical protein
VILDSRGARLRSRKHSGILIVPTPSSCLSLCHETNCAAAPPICVKLLGIVFAVFFPFFFVSSD